MRDIVDTFVEGGMDRDKVLAFGEGIARTPLLEKHEDSPVKAKVLDEFLAARSLVIEHCYKDRKFDGVYRVAKSNGERRILKIVYSSRAVEHVDSVFLRLQNECEIIRSLDGCPGVPPIDEHHYGEPAFFTMHFAEGVPLLDRKRDCLASALGMCAKVARLVDGIHMAGVIHGDIHTSNFLRDDQDNLSIIDFDCSFRPSGYIARVGGAIHFLPPERAVATWQDRSAVEPDRASDIYQAGVVMYALLTDDLPFRGATFSELSANIRGGDFRPLSKSATDELIPSAVVDFIHRCLAMDPAGRPDRIMEFPYELA
jgi:serine/threonine protein kinase